MRIRVKLQGMRIWFFLPLLLLGALLSAHLPGLQSPGPTPPTAALQLTSVLPGTPGTVNTIEVIGAVPGDTIIIAGGFSLAGATAVPGCPGLFLDFDLWDHTGGITADAHGKAYYARHVPATFAGTTMYLQAVSIGSCTKSNRYQQNF